MGSCKLQLIRRDCIGLYMYASGECITGGPTKAKPRAADARLKSPSCLDSPHSLFRFQCGQCSLVLLSESSALVYMHNMCQLLKFVEGFHLNLG
jgi:hypothetical protein